MQPNEAISDGEFRKYSRGNVFRVEDGKNITCSVMRRSSV